MADRGCITDPARELILAAINRIPKCPEEQQIARPVIKRVHYGKAIFEGKEYPSLNALAEYLGLRTTGGYFDKATDVFEKARNPDGSPAEFVYTVTKGKLRGEPIVTVSGKKKNPALKQTSKKT